eukprot:scaffold28932_cov72-Cyclotella_meneghiniana.AAC.3
MATPPQSASNHRFHSYGWSRALNYVAKCYLTEDGVPDTSQQGSDAVLTDIMLQYEANHWANEFNKSDPPRKIDFIRAYAMEFVDRPGKPMFAVERFIAGSDSYGNGFLKHNTNSGFVDLDTHRKTPQVFSAHSFYASHGERLVADIQGVGDLYTDPQLTIDSATELSGNTGDLGPRGMALFFKTFRHCDMSDLMGIPIFPLSRNERRLQAKYDEDESTLSEESSAFQELKCKFQRLDVNRERRKSVLMRPIDINGPEDKADTIRRSKSDVDEITTCLQLALNDTVFDHKAFHRFESGELKPRHFKHGANKPIISSSMRNVKSRSTVVKGIKACPPIEISDKTKTNLGKVHYHLACLHGMDRFPEVVHTTPNQSSIEDRPSHDVFSVVFHLSHAASLYNVPACLSLARARVGLDSCVSPLLNNTVPVDFESSKELCMRAMRATRAPAASKVAAGCLLFQILEDEENSGEGVIGDTEKIRVLEDTLLLIDTSRKESELMKEHAAKQSRGKAAGFKCGDKVEANYFMEGTFYPGVIIEVNEDGSNVVVQYEDDGSSEELTVENVRSMEPSSELSNGPLSDEEALGQINHDEECLFEEFELMAKLAPLLEKIGRRTDAIELFHNAAEIAMNCGKMKTANDLSMHAAELEG